MIDEFVPIVPPVVQTIVERLRALPQVWALALAGSQSTIRADVRSDFDIYVFIDAAVPVALRAELAREFAERMEIDNQFFGPGDEWIEAATGTKVDLIYFDVPWFEDQVERVLVRHQPSVGYSTAFWHTARHAQPLYDRDGWLGRLKTLAAQPYPEPLRRAIVAHNHPILRDTLSSLVYQMESALARNDMISVQHRTTALLVSYFDILFAVNRLPHPGEKRQVQWLTTRGTQLPPEMEQQLNALLAVRPVQENGPLLIVRIHTLLDRLDELLMAEQLIERTR
ncbi:MAG: DUF4037 domain-containing protein [Chloroflexi bacterium]|nr:DUF4037 domain-containing protein [Chloroflexota bacterium]